MGGVRAHRLRRYRNPRQAGWDPYDHAHPLLRWYFYKRLDVALRMADLSSDDTVVDLGCWMGHLEVSLVERARRVIGVDRADEICSEPYFEARVAGWHCLQIAQEMLQTEVPRLQDKCLLIRGDMMNLPLSSASVDVVFCLDALEHVPDLQHVLREVQRVLKSRGVFLTALPIEFGPALAIRQAAGKITSFYREPYSVGDLVKTLLTNAVPVETERGGMHHAGYDWRRDVESIGKSFAIEAIEYVPLKVLATANPTVLVKARKTA